MPAETRKHPTKRPTAAAPALTEPLLSPLEAARLLDISINTMRQWLSQRRLPFLKVGRLTKLRPSDVEKFLSEHRVEAVKID